MSYLYLNDDVEEMPETAQASCLIVGFICMVQTRTCDDLFNADLSPKRYWRRQRSLEEGEEGDCT